MSNSEDVQPVLFSAFAEALHGRRLGRDNSDAQILLTDYLILYRRFQRNLMRFCKSLEEFEQRRENEGWNTSSSGSYSEHLDDFLDSIYASAELFEFYETDILNFLSPPKNSAKDYRSLLRGFKREACLICNRCKHNRAFLQAIEIIYDNGNVVTGFCVYQRTKDVQRLNQDIHKQKEAFSFNWASRRLIANLLQADVLAAELVKTLPNKLSGEPIISLHYDLPHIREIIKIASRPTFSMPKEPAKPSVESNEFSGFIDLTLEPPPPSKLGRGRLAGVFDFIGRNLAFEMPYIEGITNADIILDNNDPRPLPGFMRMRFQDVEITDE